MIFLHANELPRNKIRVIRVKTYYEKIKKYNMEYGGKDVLFVLFVNCKYFYV